ncbi:class I SAM-dependent methyltransferase [Primorskyibacter sp. S87]|uniref:class I SAM-dependent methyltransferase n=1 Tax=Primorskyibacter sp. S87 TaxID=3415126 RepID=UPI003C7BD498
MDWDNFFLVHKGLEREGPGSPDDVIWTLEQTGLRGELSVFDGGCGPGADLETLAEALPEARITGVDAQPQFIEEAQARCARFGDRVLARVGDMADPGGPHDLIWSAGALYFLGITEGLNLWRKALKPGGWVAFSEPVMLPGERTEPELAFWEEYPAITGLDGIRARVEAAGFSVADHRLIIGEPWAAYYGPMRERIAELRADNPGTDLAAMLDLNEREADLWQAASDRIAYALLLVRPA